MSLSGTMSANGSSLNMFYSTFEDGKIDSLTIFKIPPFFFCGCCGDLSDSKGVNNLSPELSLAFVVVKKLPRKLGLFFTSSVC